MTAQRGDFDAPAPEGVAARLDELERLHAAATPGPWRQDPGHPHDIAPPPGGGDIGYVHVPADAALIVAAVNALPDLVAAERHRQQMVRLVAALVAAVDRLQEHGHPTQRGWQTPAMRFVRDQLVSALAGTGDPSALSALSGRDDHTEEAGR